MKELKPKYFLYARKSTEDDDKQVMSIEAQLFELREYARRENLEILKEFTEAKSAKTPGREQFAKMMEAIEQGHANGIIPKHKQPVGTIEIYFHMVGISVIRIFKKFVDRSRDTRNLLPSEHVNSTCPSSKFSHYIAFVSFFLDVQQNVCQRIVPNQQGRHSRLAWPSNSGSP